MIVLILEYIEHSFDIKFQSDILIHSESWTWKKFLKFLIKFFETLRNNIIDRDHNSEFKKKKW